MTLAILISVGLLGTVALLVYKYLTYHFNHWHKLGLTGPKPSLIYGNFPSAITGKRNIVYDLDDVYSQYKSKQRVIGVFMTRNPEIMILDPKLAHDILVTNFRKYRDNLSSKWLFDRNADKFAARNPFFVIGEEWKSLRADALAGLTMNKLSLAYPIWTSSAQKLGNYLKELTATAGTVELESKDVAYRFTANVMGDFLWGIDAGTFENTSQPNTFMQMGHKMLTQAMLSSGYYFSLNLVPFLKRFVNCRFFPEQTDQFFSQLMKDSMAIRRKSANANRADYMHYLMQLQEKKNLSHDDVMGHTLTTLLDGFETSANILYHTLFYLAKYPDVQHQLRAEISEHLEDAAFLPIDNLTSLPYLDQCVHETLRLITPIALFSRICTEATQLEVGNDQSIAVVPGTILTIPIFSYHHDADYFPKPYEYNPNRFDNGAHMEMTKQGIFMPFGDGPRICIGMRMALLEVKTALVEILKRYNVKCSERTMAEKKPDSIRFMFGLEGDFWLQFERL